MPEPTYDEILTRLRRIEAWLGAVEPPPKPKLKRPKSNPRLDDIERRLSIIESTMQELRK